MTGQITLTAPNQTQTFGPDQVVTVGRNSDCSFVLEGPGVSRSHAAFHHDGQSWFLTDRGSTQGTFVDGRRITAPLRIDRNVTVVFGGAANSASVVASVDATSAPTWLRPDLMATALPPAPPVPVSPRLTVIHGSNTLVISEDQVATIGRDATCTIVCDDPTVSRSHATIAFIHGAWVVEDRSTTGTYVDGERITSRTLTATSTVRLGHPVTGEALTFSGIEAGSAATAAPPPQSLRPKRLVITGAAAVALLAIAIVAVVKHSGSSNPSPDRLAQSSVQITARVASGSYSGSGTIIDAKQGLILTNAHVATPAAPGLAVQYGDAEADDPREVVISVSPGLDKATEQRFLATPVVSDGYLDLAVLKITKKLSGDLIEPDDLKGLKELAIGSSASVKTGDQLREIGYPGVAESQSVTITQGIISGQVSDERLKTNRAWFNIDALQAHGNSGGTAVDRQGRLIGIPTQGHQNKAGDKISRIRPVDLGKDLIAAARSGKTYKSPYLTPMSGKESVTDVTIVKAGRAFEFACTSAKVDSVGLAFGVQFTYSDLPADHQDAAVTLHRLSTAGAVVEEIASTETNYPVTWKTKGCATATLAMDERLGPGTYLIEVRMGPSLTTMATHKFTLT